MFSISINKNAAVDGFFDVQEPRRQKVYIKEAIYRDNLVKGGKVTGEDLSGSRCCSLQEVNRRLPHDFDCD
jgi:hypothetical protein